MANKERVATTNSAKILWPTDTWGFTREFRKAVIQAATRINGDKTKKAVFDETVKVALGFVNAKYRKDAAEKQARIEAATAAAEALEAAEGDEVEVKSAEDKLFDAE